jgi:membrane-associated phospholipid phosphatase
MINDSNIIEVQTGARTFEWRPIVSRYWQPALAYVVLGAACQWAIIPTHLVCTIGRLLGEHWYSIYNCMLAVAAMLLFTTARKTNNPALSWRVWDIALCCAIFSLCGKLIPLDRPDGGPHGFPSGHALTAFAAACLLMRTYPKVSPYAFAVATLVGWSRVEIREHFMYQVMIGALLGIIVGMAVSHSKENVGVLLPRIIRRQTPKPAPSG